MTVTNMLRRLGMAIKQASMPVMEDMAQENKTYLTQQGVTVPSTTTVLEQATTKQCNTVDTKKAKSKQQKRMVYNDELDSEIKKTEKRLYYLRHRKLTGKPYDSTGSYVSRKKVFRPRKNKEDELKVFYRTHIIDGSFKKEYDNLKENMIKHSKAFAAYHNQVFNAIRKYGNAKMMDDFDNMCHIDNIDIKL